MDANTLNLVHFDFTFTVLHLPLHIFLFCEVCTCRCDVSIAWRILVQVIGLEGLRVIGLFFQITLCFSTFSPAFRVLC
jgi:hypothetical protein